MDGCEDIDNTVTKLSAAKDEIHSELICFVVDKSKVLPVEDLVKLCDDFYNEGILEACSGILNFHKLPKRKGTERIKSTIEDIVKCFESGLESAAILCYRFIEIATN